MTDVSPKPPSALIDPGWAKALASIESKIYKFGATLRVETAQGHDYLSAGADALRAFTYLFEQVKVLIVGQDPHPAPRYATGLSFSVAPGVTIPRSLQNIFAKLESDIDAPRPPPGDLRKWSREGACLLNGVLTVRPGAPGSHRRRGWEEVTECAIDALVHRRDDAENHLLLVMILWGKDAQAPEPYFEGISIVKSFHPPPMSVRYGLFGSRPSPGANALPGSQGVSPVDWAFRTDWNL